MENPFIITGYIKPEYFCDREKEAERIINKVTGGENMVVMAARRVGKSKLIDFCWILLPSKTISSVYPSISSELPASMNLRSSWERLYLNWLPVVEPR